NRSAEPAHRESLATRRSTVEARRRQGCDLPRPRRKSRPSFAKTCDVWAWRFSTGWERHATASYRLVLRAGVAGFERNTLSVAPQVVEAVKVPRLFVEQVDDDVAVVEQDPTGLLVAFDSLSPIVEIVFELVVDLFADGVHLPHAGAR